MTHFIRRSSAAFFLIALSIWPGDVSVAEAPARRAAIPTEADQAESLELVRDIFAEDQAAAKTSEQKTALAHELLQQALESKKGSANHYILLRVARDLAILAGDPTTTSSAIQAMAAAFEVEPAALHVAAAQKLQTKTRTPDQRKTLGKVATEWANEALTDQDYEAARALLDTALAMARKGREAGLVRKLRARQKEIASTAREFARANAALETLRDNPTDPTANLEAGRYYCIVKDDWETGLPMLALGGDSELGRLARSELAAQQGDPDLLALADAWWALAKQEEGKAKVALMSHAGSWYKEALPKQEGLTRLQIEKHLEELAKVEKSLRRTDPETPKELAGDVPGDVGPKPPADVPRTRATDIWTAAIQGDVDAIKQSLAAGADANGKELKGGSTPLILAAVYGQLKAAEVLIDNGASLAAKNKIGITALHAASFFAHPETVKLLIEKGANVNATGGRGETPLDSVASPWSPKLEGVYRFVGGIFRIELDLGRIRAARPQVAAILRKAGGKTGGAR